MVVVVVPGSAVVVDPLWVLVVAEGSLPERLHLSISPPQPFLLTTPPSSVGL